MTSADILFGIVKGLQKERKDLRVIAMSAAMDVGPFAKYFRYAAFFLISLTVGP